MIGCKPTPAYLRVIEEKQVTATVGPELTALCNALCCRHGDSVAGILYYGSCLRNGEVLDGLVDLYVVLDSYRSAYGTSVQAFLNWLLPPNVFFLEMPLGDRRVRAKYAILSMRQLQLGTCRWFQPYLWGRFAQPVAVLRVRDDDVREKLLAVTGQAVLKLISATLPMLPARFTSRALWERGLALSYGTELRAERGNRNVHLFDSDRHYYQDLTAAALPSLDLAVRRDAGDGSDVYVADVPRSRRWAGRAAWSLRRVQGRMLHVLRLIKGLFTFRGGLDYVLWKLERHSGVRLEASDRVRRHPLIFGWGLMWRLYRRGAFR